MSYYEEETRALSAVLLSLYGMQGERAYRELGMALQQLAFPPAVRRLCEEALNSPAESRRRQPNIKGVRCLLQALETIGGFQHVERYITQRNKNRVFR